MKSKALIANEKDNVATATQNIEALETVIVNVHNSKIEIKVNSNIPFGHKFALKDIPKGGEVIKYGEEIGAATQNISTGDYVHVHNVESRRGRGDNKIKEGMRQ